MSSDALKSLKAGKNAVKKLKLRNGDTFLVRAGSRSERNRIEEKYGEADVIMDAIALTLWLRLANDDGSKAFEDETLTEFAKELDYDVAAEMALAIRRLDGSTENPDDLSLDDKTEKQVKNSKRQKDNT